MRPTVEATNQIISRLFHDAQVTLNPFGARRIVDFVRWRTAELNHVSVDDLGDFEELLVNGVQERIHDERIDTSWPCCPHHPTHPMDFAKGHWCCPKTGMPIARLGDLTR